MATRILFVDDEAGIRNTLKPILEQHGFEVTAAATVPEALEHMNHATFDVLLSDLNIGQPGDGFTVVSAMRRVQPQAATFILTGYPDFDTALQAIRSQVDDYLLKPTDVPTLIHTIQSPAGESPACSSRQTDQAGFTSDGREPERNYQGVAQAGESASRAGSDPNQRQGPH